MTALPFAAVIFDLDGTLVDSERLALEAGRRAFRRFGVTVAPGFLEGLIGRDRETVAQVFAAQYGDLDQSALNAAIRAESAALRRTEGAPLKPFARELVAEIAALGLPMTVATSSGRAAAEAKLARAGLRAAFRVLVSADCVHRPKPAPEPYLLAAARLGHPPARCLAFEDSDTGAEAAHAAGMRVVQVPDLVPGSGRHAHHMAVDLRAGAQAAGLLPSRDAPSAQPAGTSPE